MKEIKEVLFYLQKHKLLLTTAESCTAGKIIQLLAKIPGSGESLDAGFVVYSASAKKKVLQVNQHTIDSYSLTSEEVAREMVDGAMKHSDANVIVATTGIAGPDAKDGIPPGTVCFAWGFNISQKISCFSTTKNFSGSRTQVLTAAATYALVEIPKLHTSLKE